MPEERICAICGRSNPIAMTRCSNCGQRAQGVVLVAEEKPAATTPWWTSTNGSRPGAIPAPPQVREEVARAEAAQEREQRIRAERAERSKAALDALSAGYVAPAAPTVAPTTAVPAATPTVAAPMATKADCVRCGSPLKLNATGQGFSFCLNCGADATPFRPVMTGAAPAQTNATANAQPMFSQTVSQTASQTMTGGRTVALAGMVGVAERPTVGVSPGLASVLSFFLPGLGQIVNGQAAKGALLLLASFVFMSLWHVSGFLLVVGRVLAALDAYRIAARRREGRDIPDGEWDLG